MRNKILVMIASVLIPVSAHADEDTAIKIIGTSGGTHEFNISHVGKITFQDETFTFTFADGITDDVVFCYDEVRRMEFSNVSTGIGNVTLDYGAGDVTISFDGSTLFIKGCMEPSEVYVYDISGRPVVKRSVDDYAEISVENLSSGVYILKLNNNTFKFNKR